MKMDLQILFIVILAVRAWEIGDDPAAVDTAQAIADITAGAATTTLGSMHVCDLERIHFDTHIHMTLDGEDHGWFDDAEDILVKGTICDTADSYVALAIDDGELHGSISVGGEGGAVLSDGILQTVEQSWDPSLFEETGETGHLEADLLETLKEAKLMEQEQLSGRRRLPSRPAPGSVDIYIKLVIDREVIDDFDDSEFDAARYGVELIKLISMDSFYSMGFNLIVSEIDLRSRNIDPSPDAKPSTYAPILRAEGVPPGCHVVVCITTRDLAGGTAGVADIYSSDGGVNVCTALRLDFNKYDRDLLSHELGHNLGTEHTYEYIPRPDRCKENQVGKNSVGTIMSSCTSTKSKMEFHPRVKNVIWNAYELMGHGQKPRFMRVYDSHPGCVDFSVDRPQDAIPFTLSGNGNCLSGGIDYSECSEYCEVVECVDDAVWQVDDNRILINLDYIHRDLDKFEIEYCWTATSGCSGIALRECDGSSSQKFEVSTRNGIKSRNCGIVKFNGDSLSFNRGSAIESWCEVKFTNPPKCNAEMENIFCQQTIRGSTVDDCNGEHTFEFYGTYGTTTLSVCSDDNVQFAMTLSHVTTDPANPDRFGIEEVIMYGVEQGGCTVLQNLRLEQPWTSQDGRGDFLQWEIYRVKIAGWGGQRGSYQFDLTCSDNDCHPEDWPELQNVRGPCKALVDHRRYQTCDLYCRALGLDCVNGWGDRLIDWTEELGDIQEREAEIGCLEPAYDNDVECECESFPAPESRRTIKRDAVDDSSGASSGPRFADCDMSGWSDVSEECGPCRANVRRMSERSCDQYCGEQGLQCAGAWRLKDDDDRVRGDDECSIGRQKFCSEEGSSSNDHMICQCTDGPPRDNVCDVSNWDFVVNPCGECKAVVEIYEISCDDYCQGIGLTCVSQAEEQGDSCAIEGMETCQTPVRKEAICECRGSIAGYTEYAGKRVAARRCGASGGPCDEEVPENCINVANAVCKSYWDCAGFQVRHEIGFADDIVYFTGSGDCMEDNMSSDSSYSTFIKGPGSDDGSDSGSGGSSGGSDSGSGDSDADSGDSNSDSGDSDAGSSGGECNLASWPNVDRECGACKVLATRMRRRSCSEYCEEVGLSCVGAWNEDGDSCDVEEVWDCDEDGGNTSDLICECGSGSGSGSGGNSDSDAESDSRDSDSADDQCTTSNWPNVEEECGPCKVLAGRMRRRTCTEYCAEVGLSCVGAWEEEDNDCEVKETRRCDQDGGDTSDIICECGSSEDNSGNDSDDSEDDSSRNSDSDDSENDSNGSDNAPIEQCSTSGWPNVAKRCGDCKVLARKMRRKSCSEYCAAVGLSCVSAWDEEGNDCNRLKEEKQCDELGGDFDIICECGSTSSRSLRSDVDDNQRRPTTTTPEPTDPPRANQPAPSQCPNWCTNGGSTKCNLSRCAEKCANECGSSNENCPRWCKNLANKKSWNRACNLGGCVQCNQCANEAKLDEMAIGYSSEGASEASFKTRLINVLINVLAFFGVFGLLTFGFRGLATSFVSKYKPISDL